MQRGVTLVELVVVLALIGALVGWGIPRMSAGMDWLAVDTAAHEVASFYATARFAAGQHGTRVRVEFGKDTLRAVFEGVHDSLFRAQSGPARHGVAFRTSKSVIRIGSSGYGWGASNTTLVFRRGLVAESLTTSRLGRMKWWR
jgi:prepilin-type N-terminal cleavage/methylation domain-containing protein